MAWIAMLVAVAAEIVATLALRGSNGFTKPFPSVLAVVGYLCCFYFLAQALKTLNVGVAYAVWSGVGTAAVAVVGWLLFGDRLNGPGALGVALIVVGVIVLALSGSTHQA